MEEVSVTGCAYFVSVVFLCSVILSWPTRSDTHTYLYTPRVERNLIFFYLEQKDNLRLYLGEDRLNCICQAMKNYFFVRIFKFITKSDKMR